LRGKRGDDEATENTIDEKESPKKQKMMTIRKGLQKN